MAVEFEDIALVTPLHSIGHAAHQDVGGRAAAGTARPTASFFLRRLPRLLGVEIV